jgi:hypothetical protein
VTRLYPQALISFLVASYDYQGYGGGIRLHLHKGKSFRRIRENVTYALKGSDKLRPRIPNTDIASNYRNVPSASLLYIASLESTSLQSIK